MNINRRPNDGPHARKQARRFPDRDLAAGEGRRMQGLVKQVHDPRQYLSGDHHREYAGGRGGRLIRSWAPATVPRWRTAMRTRRGRHQSGCADGQSSPAPAWRGSSTSRRRCDLVDHPLVRLTYRDSAARGAHPDRIVPSSTPQRPPVVIPRRTPSLLRRLPDGAAAAEADKSRSTSWPIRGWFAISTPR